MEKPADDFLGSFCFYAGGQRPNTGVWEDLVMDSVAVRALGVLRTSFCLDNLFRLRLPTIWRSGWCSFVACASRAIAPCICSILSHIREVWSPWSLAFFSIKPCGIMGFELVWVSPNPVPVTLSPKRLNPKPQNPVP